MAFVLYHSNFTPHHRRLVFQDNFTSTHYRRASAAVKLALSEPGRKRADANRVHTSSNSFWSRSRSASSDNDYNGWSSDFLELCNAQLDLLRSTIPNIAQVALFFRYENPTTGALEFVPLIVHSSNEEDHTGRVWISSGAGGQTELEDPHFTKVLPGGIPAEWILPEYPFKTVGGEGGFLMPDGCFCIPIEYNNVLAGSIVLMPSSTELSRPSHQHINPWSHEDIRRADMVAKSIALGAALEGKWHATEGLLGSSRSVIESARSLLRMGLHQIRSPLAALVTFGHLLLRKLPPGDTNRGLAKNMILEALRLDELLEPLDIAGDNLVLPEAPSMRPWFDPEGKEEASASCDIMEEGPERQAQRSDALSDNLVLRTPTQSTPAFGSKQMVWLSDILVPLADVFSVLAREKGMQFVTEIDHDTPAVTAVEKFVREAVSNLVDNSLKYAGPGSIIGLNSRLNSISGQPSTDKDVVEVIVWDTGPGFLTSDLDRVWDFGFRGSAATRQGTVGSGLGLAIVKELLNASGAEVFLESPLPSFLDPRGEASQKREAAPGSAFFIQFERPDY